MPKMTEAQFCALTNGLDLSKEEIAILRKDFGLTYNNNDLGAHGGHPVTKRRLLTKAWSKINAQSHS